MMNVKKGYDLEERTTKFSISILRLCRSIRPNYLNKNIISQVMRSGTSIGANYSEANGASSKKDFRNKIYICKKEVQETKYWLRLLKESEPEKELEAKSLWNEAQELTLIFGKIVSTIDNKKC